MTGHQVYGVEVDVAIARPPTPANTRTVFVRVAVPLDLPDFTADAQARETACQMASGVRGVGTALPGMTGDRVVMPVAARIVDLTL